MPTPRLILASRSPRRAMLLREAGYAFTQMTPPFDDTGHEPQADTPQQIAITLAARKADSIAPTRPRDCVVLCADTLCVGTDGSPLGKPTSREHARSIIRSFANADHDIVTGVAMIDANGDQHVFADTATATFGGLSDDTVEAYLRTDDWHDKAGGYNLFDRQAAGWPIVVHGDATTVVGLPMQRLNTVLPSLGIAPVPTHSPAP